MSKKVQINLFSSKASRLPLCLRNLIQISRVHPKLKQELLIVVYTTPELSDVWDKEITKFRLLGIDMQNSPCKTYNYMERTMQASKTDCVYSCRLDDDLFMSSHVWEFMLFNLHILENENLLYFTPEFTTGIPTVDFFIDDFFDSHKRDDIHRIFIEDNIPTSPWYNVDFSHVKNKVSTLSHWDTDAYYDELSLNATVFKGLHPIRFSDRANLLMCEEVINNFDKFMTKQDHSSMRIVKNLHFTHFLFFKTETWTRALEIRYDDFDEISFNQYGLRNSGHFAIPKNSFAIHTAHGYVNNQNLIEELYTDCITKNAI